MPKAPSPLPRDLVGQGRFPAKQHQGNSVLRQSVSPPWYHLLDGTILPEQFFPEEIGATVDEDLLLRPRIHEVATPGELAEETTLQLLPACFCHRGNRENAGIELI